MSVRKSIHFSMPSAQVPGASEYTNGKDHQPPQTAVAQTVQPVPTPAHPTKNPMESLADLARDIVLLREKFQDLLTTDNRHGDLAVMRTAAKRIVADLSILIDIEEL
jgi:hypothetical protein